MDRFGSRLREEVDLATLERELSATVTTSLRPARSWLWLTASAREDGAAGRRGR